MVGVEILTAGDPSAGDSPYRHVAFQVSAMPGRTAARRPTAM
jgi:hypothetical protein